MANIRLNENLESRLDDLALKTGRTKSFYIRKAVEEAIDDMEDAYIAIQRMENEKEYISSEQMRKDLGLEN